MNKVVEKRQLIVHRLSEEVFQQLVKKFPPPMVNNETSAHHAGYLLGIQQVLKVIREGIVTDAN
jgi:hypothetical protein